MGDRENFSFSAAFHGSFLWSIEESQLVSESYLFQKTVILVVTYFCFGDFFNTKLYRTSFKPFCDLLDQD